MVPRPGLPAFTPTTAPSASVIIPVHGKWPLTLDCLRSLADDAARHSFEVVVVDDWSLDETAVQLQRVPGLMHVSTPENLGFVGACNLGAASARGEFLVFLNNDTLVHRGWLDALLDILDEEPDVGLVGSLLLGADGMVQESGGIIWSDASGYNYGRGLPPSFAEIRAVRDVDYCSGAAIAVRAALFDELGGFDARYSPAYYEDTDLAFAVRAAGYRVVVQPESVVSHLEGQTHGTEATGGLKRFQAVNREAFRRKWRSVLPAHGVMEGPRSLWTARNRKPGGMVLIADPNVPTPDRDSGSRRMAAIIDELLDLKVAIYFAPSEHIAIQPYTRNLERKGVTVLLTHDEQDRFIREAGPALDAAILCRPHVAWSWLDRVYRWAPDATVVYDTVDLHSLRMMRQAEVEQDTELARIADLVWIQESGAMRASDITLVVSEFERTILADRMPGADVRVLSNIHAPVVTAPRLTGRHDILFVGGYQHLPNVDAARWAVEAIMPLVRRSVPEATLRLVGSHMPPTVAELAGPGVEATGWLDDLTPAYGRARVVIAPLRYGAGVKGKVAEAIEHGVPVVGTSMAFEGINLVDGVDVLFADAAAEFADAIVRLLTDDQAWIGMAGRGQERIAAQFSSTLARSVLTELLDPSSRDGRVAAVGTPVRR